MDQQNAPGGGGAKGSVKFSDQNPSSQSNDQVQEAQKETMTRQNAAQCKDFATGIFNKIANQFQVFTNSDPTVIRKDTAKGLVNNLQDLKSVLAQLNMCTFEDKNQVYYLTYNATIYLFDICKLLRKSVYTSQVIEYLAYAIISLEGFILLMSVKYLEWRMQFYIQLANAYSELGSYVASARVVDQAISQINQLKEIQEKDPPIPDYMDKMFQTMIRTMRCLEIKFKLQNGSLNVDAWKKKIEETFSNDPEGQILAVIESLRISNSKSNNFVEKNGKSFPWQENAVQVSFDMYQGDAEMIAQSLEQINDQLSRTLDARTKSIHMSEEERIANTNKNRELDANMIQEKDFQRACASFPLQYHIQMLYYAFQTDKAKIFQDLSKWALIRSRFRRFQTPYICDIDILPNQDPNPNIPNGYQQVPVDLNEASLRLELKKLRNQSQAQNEQKQEEKKDDQGGKPAPPAGGQGAGSQQPPPQQQQNQQQGVIATQQELDQIDHTYMYLIIKRSPHPERAIYAVDVAMGDQEEGPVNQLHEGWFAKAIPIRQYTGVRQQNQTVPYLLMKYTQDNLKNEEEKLRIVTDMKPIFGRNPMIRPDSKFEKIPLELRQTPEVFIRSPNMEYVFIEYQNDRDYFVNERQLQILIGLMELEKSFGVPRSKQSSIPTIAVSPVLQNNEIFKGTTSNNNSMISPYNNASSVSDTNAPLIDEKYIELDIVYSLQRLNELFEIIKYSLVGPLGEFFVNEKPELLINICFFLYKKYFISPLYQFEYIHELRISEEISDDQYVVYKGIIEKAKDVFINGLQVMNQVIMFVPSADILWTTKFNLELAKLWEQRDEFKLAAQSLRQTLQRIISQRDELLQRGVESQRDLFLPFSITCSNLKIQQMIQKMKEKYIESQNNLNMLIRQNERKQTKQENHQKYVELEQDEKKEEEFETLEAAYTFLGDDNKDSEFFQILSTRDRYTQTERILNALHVDIALNLYRCELKAGNDLNRANFVKNKTMQLANNKDDKSIGIIFTQTQADKLKQIPPGEDYEGISNGLQFKTTIMKQETAVTIKNDHSNLQQTLQEAGKLPAPQPVTTQYQQTLLADAGSNPYLNALIHMEMSTNKSQIPEQKFLLAKAFQFIIEAQDCEEKLIKKGIEDAIFVVSSLLDNKEADQLSKNIFPFKTLYNKTFIQRSKMPRQPILISRNASSITMQMPPYRPLLSENQLTRDPQKENVVTMSIYGKPSANGVNVSLTCIDLYNTGIRHPIDAVVTIKNLLQNEKYCFAVAGYVNASKYSNSGEVGEELSNDTIGLTGEDIVCMQPMPINLICSHLAQTAYQIGDFETAERAVDHAFTYFLQKSEYLDRLRNFEENVAFFYRIRQKALKSVSVLEVHHLIENFIIKARCLKRKFFSNSIDGETEPTEQNIIPIEHQKHILAVANYLLLAVQVSVSARSFITGKRAAIELYNHMIELLNFRYKTYFMFHILLQSQLLVTEIPKQYWDKNFRLLSARLTYELTKLSLQYNQNILTKRITLAETKLFNRKFYTVPQIVMITQQPPPVDPQDAQKAPPPQQNDKKPGKDDQQEEPGEPAPPPKLIPKLFRYFYESSSSVQTYLEDTLLSFPEDMFDLVQKFVDNWKTEIEFYLQYVQKSQEEKDALIASLSTKLNNWEYMRDLPSAWIQVQADLKGSPFYLEVACRLFKRLFEANADLKQITDCLNQLVEPALPEHVKVSLEIRDLKLQAVENDIDWFPDMLRELIREKETNKFGNDKAIEIFTKYFGLKQQLDDLLFEEKITTKETEKFAYIHVFQSEISFIRAIAAYQASIYGKLSKNNNGDDFCNVNQLDQHGLISAIQEEQQLQSFEKSKDPQFIAIITQVFQMLSQAAVNSVHSQSWMQLQNILKFLFNLISFETLNPFTHQGEKDIWKYLTIISYCSISMLAEIKQHKGLYAVRDDWSIKMINIRSQNYNDFEEERKRKVRFSIGEENQTSKDKDAGNDLIPQGRFPILDQNQTKQFWFKEKDLVHELETELIANIIAYNVQCLMIEEKWNSLVAITRDFCNVTNHYFSSQILPFTIYAQEILLDEAAKQTNEKKEALKKRTEEYEIWKTTQKKKSRAAALTGEIPQEEKDFLRDEAEFKHQIDLLLEKENFIRKEKNISEQMIGEINRDANQAIEELYQVRIETEKFGYDFQSLNHKDDKIYLNLGSTIVTQFQDAIGLLEKRDLQFYCALARRDLANLFYCMNQLDDAYMFWMDALDTLFSRPQMLYYFRKALTDYGPSYFNANVAFKIGTKPMLIAANVLHNIVYAGNKYDLHWQREGLVFASEIVYDVFKISHPHPLIACQYGEYRMQEIVQKQNIFRDTSILDPTETLLAMDRLAWMLIDSDMPLRALPILALHEYLATDIVQSFFYSFRSKALQAIALSHIGFINEGYQYLQKIIKEKDFPIPWLKRSEMIQREKGTNWFYDGQGYNNTSHPYEDTNQEIIDEILNQMELSQSFAVQYGQSNINLFMYARCAIMYAICQYEVYEMFQVNEIRCQNLIKTESILRELLQKISFEEQVETMAWQMEQQQNKANQLSGGEQESVLKEVAEIKDSISNYFASKRSMTDKNEQEAYFSNREENRPYVNKREQRLEMIARIRFLMCQMSNSMNLFSRSFLIIKDAIVNLYRYGVEYRMVEDGEDKDILNIDNFQPVAEDTSGQGAKGGPGAKQAEEQKAPPPADKADPKKGAPGKKGVADSGPSEEELKKKEEIRLQKIESERLILMEAGQKKRYRQNLGAFWWIKLSTELCKILYQMNKLTEAQAYIEQVKKDIGSTKKESRDPIFLRILNEYMGRILVKLGQFDDGIKYFEEAIKHGEECNHNDLAYPRMIGDYAELLYQRGHYQQAMKLFDSARLKIEDMLQDISYRDSLQNHNKMTNEEEKEENDAKDRVGIQYNPQHLILQADEDFIKKQDFSQQQGGKGGKQEDKKGPGDKGQQAEQKGGGQVEEARPEMKISVLNQLPKYNFIKETKMTGLQQIDSDIINNTQQAANCYIKYIPVYMRAVLRYVNCYFELLKQDDQVSDKILEHLQVLETMKEQSKNFTVPISLHLELNFQFGRFFKLQFLRLVKSIQDMYLEKYLANKQSSDPILKENAMKYRKLYEQKPFRDLCRNKFLIDVPNFSQQLKQVLVELLEKAEKRFDQALSMLSRGECLIYEFSRDVEDIYFQMAELYLLNREYRARIGFKHLDLDELQKQIDQQKALGQLENNQGATNISNYLENTMKTEGKTENSDTQAYQHLVLSTEVYIKKLELNEQYHDLGLVASVNDLSKLPLDIYFDIIDSDFIYQKNYSALDITGRETQDSDATVFLFDEAKKQAAANTIDLYTYLIKLGRESQFFTFSGGYLQNQISKLHRFLKSNLTTSYGNKCVLVSMDITTQGLGQFIVQSKYIRRTNQYQFLYILCGLDKANIKSPLKIDEINSFIMNPENELLYGTIYITAQELSDLQQQCLDLRTKMQESDQQTPQAKERDYKRHKKRFFAIIEEYGSYFHCKLDPTTGEVLRPSVLQKDPQTLSGDEQELPTIDVLDQYAQIIPDLTLDAINTLINLFSSSGLKTCNNNFLAIFRHFHHAKYK